MGYILKFGENLDIDTSDETLWDVGGLYPWDTFNGSNISLEVVSNSVNDTAAGTGARTIEIEGLSSYAVTKETVTLDGTTPVALANQYNAVYRASIVTAGSGKANAGTINVQTVGGATVVAAITSGNSQTLMCVYTVPEGSVGEIHRVYASSGNNKDAGVKLFVRQGGPGGAFAVKGSWSVFQSVFEFNYHAPLTVPEKSDIELRVISDSVNTTMRGGFDLVLGES